MSKTYNKIFSPPLNYNLTRYRENNKIIFNLRSDGIFETNCFPGTHMTFEDGLESTRITSEMIDFEPKPLLCDLSNVVSMSKECRKHFAGEEHAKTFTKCALIVTNPISRIIGNFFLGLNKPLKPTKIFLSREDAIKWLLETV